MMNPKKILIPFLTLTVSLACLAQTSGDPAKAQSEAKAQAEAGKKRIWTETQKAAGLMREKKFVEAKEAYLKLASDPFANPDLKKELKIRSMIADVESLMKQRKNVPAAELLTRLSKEEFPDVKNVGILTEFSRSCAALLVRLQKDAEAAALFQETEQRFMKSGYAPESVFYSSWVDLLSGKKCSSNEIETIYRNAMTRYLEKQNNVYECLKLAKLYVNFLLVADRYEEALKVCRNLMDGRKLPAPLEKQFLTLMAEIHVAAGQKADAATLYRQVGSELTAAFIEGGYAAKRSTAKKMLADSSIPIQQRIQAMQVFCDETSIDQGKYYKSPRPPIDLADNQAMRAAYLHEFAQTDKISWEQVIPWGEINTCMWYQLFDSVVGMLEPFWKAGKPIADREVMYYAASLAVTGRVDDAFSVWNKIASDQKRPAALRFRAVLCTKGFPCNTKNEIRAAYDAARKQFEAEKPITEKSASEDLIYLGKLFMAAKKYDQAKQLWQAYEGLFRAQPPKSYSVKFSDQPLYDISSIRAFEKMSEAQPLDRSYGGNLDFMSTDVSTGRTAAQNTPSGKSVRVPEFSALCDENGIHLLFRTYDPQARASESGLRGAGGYEMYLAPGANQPYTCFLTNQGRGTVDVWNTTYPNEHHRRFNTKEPKEFRMDQQFLDDGYLTHLFLSWNNYYDTLPEPGDFYEFESCFWGAQGGFSWNGLKVIHGRSSWGRLTFEIAPAQILKIKRKLVLSALASYKKESWTGIEHHGVFDRWNDPVLGDPAFYAEKVLPFKEKLDSYTALIQAEMSDADVEKVFQEALPEIREIRFKIESMRKQWMEEQLTRE